MNLHLDRHGKKTDGFQVYRQDGGYHQWPCIIMLDTSGSSDTCCPAANIAASGFGRLKPNLPFARSKDPEFKTTSEQQHGECVGGGAVSESE